MLAKSLAAVRWNYIGIVARVATQLIAQVALARLLDPHAFGAVAIAMLILGFAAPITEAGMTDALIQRPKIEERDIRSAFTLVLALSALFAILIYWGRFLFARAFDEPVLAELLPIFLVIMMVQPVSAISTGLLLRKMDFKATQISTVVSYFSGFFVVGIGGALMNAGVWSLAAAWVTQYIVYALLVYRAARFRLMPALYFRDRRMPRFGAYAGLSNLVLWFTENVSNLFIGKIFGAAPLGNYAVALSVARSPADHLVSSVQHVLFSGVAAMQDNRRAVKRGYLLTVGTLAFVSCPVFFGLATTADTVVDALYGSKWNLAGALLLPIALAMPFHALMSMAGATLWGVGNADAELWGQTAVGVVLTVCLFVASAFSIYVLAWSVFGVYVLRAAVLTACAVRAIDATSMEYLRNVSGPLLFGILIGMALFGVDLLLKMNGTLPLARLTVLLGGGAALAMLVPPVLKNWVVPPVLGLFLKEQSGRIPRFARGWVLASAG